MVIKENESKPFYTVEFKNGSVEQFYGYGNIGKTDKRGVESDS